MCGESLGHLVPKVGVDSHTLGLWSALPMLSVCNKPFKPLEIFRRLVKSREGLIEMLPTNYVTNMLSRRIRNHINNVVHLLTSLN
jgi:hypothetical protein